MDGEGGGQTLPLIRLLIHLNMEFPLCYLYPSQSWSQGPFWRLWVGWRGYCQRRNCSAQPAVTFCSCGVAGSADQRGTKSPARCCPSSTAGVGRVEWLRSSPQPRPSRSKAGCPCTGAGKGMVLRAGICPPRSSRCVVQELDTLLTPTVRVRSPAESLLTHRPVLPKL